jgi:hypoxanthine phosphoribosyltransferase
MSKQYFDWNDYQAWIDGLVNNYDDGIPTCFVSIFRGSLIPVTHITNVIKGSKMAIVKFQSYDGTDENASWIHVPDWAGVQRFVIVDDIIDTGKTLKKVERLLHQNLWRLRYANTISFDAKVEIPIEVDVMVDKLGNRGSYTVDADAWVVFPWEQSS